MSGRDSERFELPCRHEPASVALTPEQVEHAFAVGDRVVKNYRAGKKGVKTRWTPRDHRDVIRQSMAAELAVATFLKLPWNEGDPKKCDVGNRIEVRHTRQANYPLVLHGFDRNKLLSAFVLVNGTAPYFDLIGWASGARGLNDAWRFEPNLHPLIRSFNGGWTVPRHFLWSIASLVLEVEANRAPVVEVLDDVPDEELH